MKLIERPSVRLASLPGISAFVQGLMPSTDASTLETLASFGAKACYDAHGPTGRSARKNLEQVVKNEHYSVLEHATVGVFITGISRGCSHELVRHRHFSYSQRSTRYTSEDDARVVLEPRVLALRNADPTEFEKYIAAIASAFVAYRRAVLAFEPLAPALASDTDRRKFARGAARQLLPHALETQIMVTGNLRTWREVFLLRTERTAEAEIRRLFHHLWHDVFENIAPSAFSDFRARTVDGFTELYRHTPLHTQRDQLRAELNRLRPSDDSDDSLPLFDA